MASVQRTNLCDFYEDAEIFITGGLGNIGTIYIECLLRLCNVRCIYMLLRPKKNLSVAQRLDKFRNDKIFERLKTEKPNELLKLVPIAGDIVLPNLGVTDDAMKQLENVAFVCHCAATIRFDEPLNVAINLNIGGTLNAINLAKRLKYLKLFIHVSTFYSNPYLYDVEPKLYPPPMDWRFCLNWAENNYNDDIADALTSKIITGFPNTYTFTKNLAETLVNDYRHELPIAIVRPSVVIFSAQDPEPGHPSASAGIMRLFALVLTGLLKAVYASDCMLDMIPQDICAKFMAYYTFKATEEYKRGSLDSVPVYNLAIHKYYPYTLEHRFQILEELNLYYKYAPMKSALLPGLIFTSNEVYYKFLYFTKQLAPALLIDGILMLCGRKPAVMGIMRRIISTLTYLTPFRFNNYTCTKSNYDDYFEDTKDTPFSLSRILNRNGIIVTESLFDSMIKKLRDIMVNDDPNTIRTAQKIYTTKLIIYHLFRAFFVYKLLCVFYRRVLSVYL